MDQSPEERAAQWKEVFRKYHGREPGWEDALLGMVEVDASADREPRFTQKLLSRRERASAQLYLLTRGRVGRRINPAYQAYLKRQWRKRLTPQNERILIGCEYVVYTLGKLASRWRQQP